MRRKAVFIDKDGTLVVDVPYNVDPQKIELQPGALEGLRRLHTAGFDLMIATNQSGVARGFFPETALQTVEQQLRRLLAQGGIPLADFYYCPHHPEGVVAGYAVDCECRKPRPGLLLRAAREHEIDLAESWFIGDILNDIEAGNRAGCRTVLLNNGNETMWEMGPQRQPDYEAPDLKQAATLILQSERVGKDS